MEKKELFKKKLEEFNTILTAYKIIEERSELTIDQKADYRTIGLITYLYSDYIEPEKPKKGDDNEVP